MHDLCIYGATSGGCALAAEAAALGHSVVLIEPTRHLGGMSSAGLGWTDYGVRETIGGRARRFYEAVAEHYRSEGFGDACFQGNPGWNRARDAGKPFQKRWIHPNGNGWCHEPRVAEAIFEDWVDHPGIERLAGYRLNTAHTAGGRIRSIVLDYAPQDARGAPPAHPIESAIRTVDARFFVDASYEGDLLASAGIHTTVRRESRRTYGEPMAGIIYGEFEHESERPSDAEALATGCLGIDPWRREGEPESGLLPHLQQTDAPFPLGAADDAVQAYNFRLCLTDHADNRVPIEPVGDYDPEWYEIVVRWLRTFEETGGPTRPRHFHHYSGAKPLRVFKISPLPNAKSDVNNAGSFVSSDFVGQNYSYPEGDWAVRRRIWLAHEDYQRGLHYFMRTDPRIPDEARAEVAQWGLARDEFTDTGHWPFQLYVREARRMVGDVVMTQNHCLGKAPVDDSVGLGSYSLDSHLCRRFVWNGKVFNEGGFLFRNPAKVYPISYRSLLPKRSECANLASLFCFSASHAAFSTLRMEPVLMILGESLAHATDLALKDGCGYQDVSIASLQNRLRDAGQLLDRDEVLAGL